MKRVTYLILAIKLMEESKIMFEGKIFSKLKNPMHDWDYPIPHDVFENDKNVFEKLLTTIAQLPRSDVVFVSIWTLV